MFLLKNGWLTINLALIVNYKKEIGLHSNLLQNVRITNKTCYSSVLLPEIVNPSALRIAISPEAAPVIA